MPLNKSTGNMYPFITHTWNPIKGICPHDCSYCYMKGINKRFGKIQEPLYLSQNEMKTTLGSGKFIFVGSSCDMWANDISEYWINNVLRKCSEYPENKYLFQTKNPERLTSSLFSLSADIHKICTTIETNQHIHEIMRNSPHPFFRAEAMQKLFKEGFETIITIEPIMEFDLDMMIDLIHMAQPAQVNIGADSGNNHLPEPSKEKVLALISELEKFTTVYQKKNLRRLING